MPYVSRDEQENITAIYVRPQFEGDERYSENHPDIIAYRLIGTIKLKADQLKSEMYRVLADGFQWRETNADDWFVCSIDIEMQGFLTRTLLKLNEGRVDPHGGFIRSNGVSVSIDDVGIREVCLFAGVWGDAISAINITTLDAVTDWDAFDPSTVDWSVNWSGADAANGWNDNTLTQAP